MRLVPQFWVHLLQCLLFLLLAGQDRLLEAGISGSARLFIRLGASTSSIRAAASERRTEVFLAVSTGDVSSLPMLLFESASLLLQTLQFHQVPPSHTANITFTRVAGPSDSYSPHNCEFATTTLVRIFIARNPLTTSTNTIACSSHASLVNGERNM